VWNLRFLRSSRVRSSALPTGNRKRTQDTDARLDGFAGFRNEIDGQAACRAFSNGEMIRNAF